MITLDIETIPTDDPVIIAEIAATILPPRTMSKPETIAKWEKEEKPALVDEAVRKTAFDGTHGRICCIGWAVDDTPSISTCGTDEFNILKTFFHAVSEAAGLYAHTIVGHNVSGFDLRFLWQRCVVWGERPPSSLPFQAKPWDKTIGDTMLMWNPERERRISLDRLCKALGVPTSKGDMDGSKVYDAFKAGEYTKIAEYCRADVDATRACYKRMLFS